MAPWRDNIIGSDDEIRRLLEEIKTIAVIGIKTEKDSYKPAFTVPEFMLNAGYDIFPVPVYYPEVTHILGRLVYRKLADIPAAIDMVNVFRRPSDIPAHIDDILAKRPKAVWFQLGIRNDDAAETLARSGIKVVQDMCLMVEYGRLKMKNRR